MPTEAFIGIDVARDSLEVASRPAGEHWQVPNDPVGIAALLPRLRALQPTLIVLEATGGLELPVVAAIGSAGLPVVAVNPRQVRDFAKAIGKLAKTDAIDARVLAHFADAVRPAVRALPDAATRALGALVTRRRQLVEMLTAEENRRHTAPTAIRADIQAHISWLRKRLKGVIRSSARQSGPARSGASRRTCCAVCRELAQSSASRCWPTCPNLEPSTANRSLRWSAWRHSTVTAARCMASARSGVGGQPSELPYIWQPSWAVGATRSSTPCTRASWQPEKPRRSP
jgi:Transposase